MGTSLIRAMLLASAGVAVAVVGAPNAAYAQETAYQIDIPAQSMGDALRALGKATKQNIVFSGASVKGKRSAAVRGRMSVNEALAQMLAGSGLKMGRGSGGGFTVVQGGNGGAAPARAEASASGSNVVAAPSASASTVVDARTGAALRGALVEIIETGEKASTGQLGEFRFPGKNGSFNLRFSYLGYPQYEQFVDLKDGRATSGILLSDGSAVGEIVVTAYQSSRAQALNQKRTADNVSTIISSDLLGDFPGSTVSEALRQAPGITFVTPDYTRGDGTNIAVRGLEPNLNNVTLNGIELPVGDGTGRAPDLGNILADSLSSIKINKTLLPSQDSAGTGGQIEIETRSPLDRPRRYLNASIEYGKSGKGYGDDALFSSTVSGKIAENFGLSASVQYRTRKLISVAITPNMVFGDYLPIDVDGSLVSYLELVDPRLRFPFDSGAKNAYISDLTTYRNDVRSKNLTINLAAQWVIGDHTDLRADYLRAHDVTDNFAIAASAVSGIAYNIRPVAALGGEERYALGWDGNMFGSLFGLDSRTKSKTESYSFRGNTHLGNIELKYAGGYTNGTNKNISSTINAYSSIFVDPSLVSPDAIDPVEGIVLSPFGRVGRPIPGPLLTEAGIDLLNDPNSYSLGSSGVSKSAGRNSRYVADFSARHTFEAGSIIKYLEAGAQFKRSRFEDSFTPGDAAYGLGGTLGEFGIGIDSNSLERLGIATQRLPFMRRSDIQNFLAGVQGYADAGLLFIDPAVPDPRDLQEFTIEKDLSGYVQVALQFGKLEIIGGVRATTVSVDARISRNPTLFLEDFSQDQAFRNKFRAVFDQSASQSNIVPRVLTNVRLDEDTVLRAGYYQTVARPVIRELSDRQAVTLLLAPFGGPSGNQPSLVVVSGNPALKPASTHNFDVSVERYDRNIGVMTLGLFYKIINNRTRYRNAFGEDVLDGVPLPDDPRFTLEYLRDIGAALKSVMPINADEPAKIWGIEASVEHRFNWLPGILKGFGVYANYTYTKSKSVEYFEWQSSPILDTDGNITGRQTVTIPLPAESLAFQSPHSGTAALTYNLGGLDARVSYTYQEKARGQIGGYGLSFYDSPGGSLDLRLAYQVDLSAGKYRFFLEANDLLRGRNDPRSSQIRGGDGNTPAFRGNAFYLGGRTMRAGISATF